MLVLLFTHPWCGLWLNFEVLQNIDRKCLSGGYCRFLLKYQLFDFCLGVDFYHFNWNIILYSSASLCILIHINVFQKVNRIHMMRLNLIFFSSCLFDLEYNIKLGCIEKELCTNQGHYTDLVQMTKGSFFLLCMLYICSPVLIVQFCYSM